MSRVPPDVLAILSELEFPEADLACFPERLGQIDRGLYVRVDKVLRALGGHWSGRRRAHVFSGSRAPAELLVDYVLTSGEVSTNRDLGNFATPVLLAKELVALAGVAQGHQVLEPSAGTGRLVDELLVAGAWVTAVERDQHRRDALVRRTPKWSRRLRVAPTDDFMAFEPSAAGPRAFDRVVMNPPFCRSGLGDHLDHVRRAHGFLAPVGVLVSVLPSSVTFRRDRRHLAFRQWLAQHAGDGTDDGVVRDLPAGTFRESGTEVRSVVVRLRRVG